jgi:hypothetical protein
MKTRVGIESDFRDCDTKVCRIRESESNWKYGVYAENAKTTFVVFAGFSSRTGAPVQYRL